MFILKLTQCCMLDIFQLKIKKCTYKCRKCLLVIIAVNEIMLDRAEVCPLCKVVRLAYLEEVTFRGLE